MKKILGLLIIVFISVTIEAQVFFTESFETTSGWSLSHTFDDLDDSFCKRDSATATALPGLQYSLSGADGVFVIAAEDTDADLVGAPLDGEITLSVDPTSISGYSNLELVVALSCNSDDMAYDDRALSNGDYLDFEVNIDGGGWTSIGQFNSADGGTSISTLYQDVNMDGNGGQIGELPVGNALSDFVMPISATGSEIEIRALFHFDGSDEEIVIDELRLRESVGDDVAPQVFSIEILDQSTLQITFSEDVNVANSELTFHYGGLSGLTSAVVSPGNVVTLNYSSPFELGQEQNLVVFSIQDLAGNIMTVPYAFDFFFNPNTPELVITEIMYNDPTLVDTLEYIEIYNNGATEVNIGGFRLQNAINHTIESGTMISAGGFYLAARNQLSALSFYGLVFQDYGGQFSDNTEIVELVNAEGTMIDIVDYNDNVPWPTAADGGGPSMELVSPDLDNMIGSNWVASTNGLGFVDGVAVFGTPGFLPTGIQPVVQFDNNGITVNEADGTIALNIYISASNATTPEIGITYLSGTAVVGADHDLGTIASLSLPANSMGVEELVFPLYEDLLDESVEYFTIGLSAVNNCVTGANSEIKIVITDNDHTPPTLFINELQSGNLTDIVDEAMQHEDWFEIYNPNAFAVDIAGYYVSDDATDLVKDRLIIGDASTIIPANGWLLVWADQDPSQGPLHADFKLSSASGESVVLTSQDGVQVIDQVDFGPLPTDVSYGRNGDGDALWVEFTQTTPNAMNLPLSISEYKILEGVYPNPTTGLVYLPEVMRVQLYDLCGRLVLASQNTSVIDLGPMDQGVYLLTTEDGRSIRLIKR